MQRHITSHLKNNKRGVFGEFLVVGRQKPAHHQE
jgi:hypothetical protein